MVYFILFLALEVDPLVFTLSYYHPFIFFYFEMGSFQVAQVRFKLMIRGKGRKKLHLLCFLYSPPRPVSRPAKV